MAKQLLVVDRVEERIGNVRAYIIPLTPPFLTVEKGQVVNHTTRKAQEVMETIYPHLKGEMRAGKEYHFFEVDEVLHEVRLHREP